MTRDKYIRLAEKARTDSIEKRWKILAKYGSVSLCSVIDCSFCKLAKILMHNSTKYEKCDLCPAPKTEDGYCSEGHKKWLRSITESERKEAARGIIREIKAADISAWANELVEMGVLKGEPNDKV